MRLITNPEKMVVRETQRAFVCFSLHGLTVDTVIVNRVLPSDVSDRWFNEWRRHVDLPRSMTAFAPYRARLENRVLTVELKEAQ